MLTCLVYLPLTCPFFLAVHYQHNHTHSSACMNSRYWNSTPNCASAEEDYSLRYLSPHNLFFFFFLHTLKAIICHLTIWQFTTTQTHSCTHSFCRPVAFTLSLSCIITHEDEHDNLHIIPFGAVRAATVTLIQVLTYFGWFIIQSHDIKSSKAEYYAQRR